VEGLQLDLAGRMTDHWLTTGAKRISWTWSDRHSPCRWTRQQPRLAASRQNLPVELPVEVRTVDDLAARTLGITGHGTVLVRPDAVPVARWSSSADATDRLVDAVTSVYLRNQGVATTAPVPSAAAPGTTASVVPPQREG
jgi:hypothetical protein